MSIATLLTRPCVLVKRTRQPGGDSYGDDTLTDGERIDLLGQVHQRTTAEELAAQDTTTAGWVGMFTADAPIERDDVIEVDGVRFQIVGEPFRVWHPLKRATHHVEVSLIEVHG